MHVQYIRPFLSSTFRDFNAERNILTTTVFPRLEKLCTDRGVFFAPLDLRWGVTSEQSGSGQVKHSCHVPGSTYPNHGITDELHVVTGDQNLPGGD